MAYILDKDNEEGCVFCMALEEADGIGNLIVYRGQHSFIILNRYPYTSGHVMVVPYQHEASLSPLSQETRTEMMELTSQLTQVIGGEYQPQGFNLGMNIGAAAGAGIAEHVHLHVVPRWGGDTNFMSSVGSTRVLPESLEDTYWRIRKAWEHIIPSQESENE